MPILMTTVTITITIPSSRNSPYTPMEGRELAELLRALARELKPLNNADTLHGKQLKNALGEHVGTFTATTQEL